MVQQSSQFTKSSYFYAIDFSNIRAEAPLPNAQKIIFPAVWFKVKAEQLTVVKGHLWHYTRKINAPQDVLRQDFMDNFDGRYGGQAEFRWDGINMWAPQKSFQETASAQNELAQYLEQGTVVPAGYEGWFSIRR